MKNLKKLSKNASGIEANVIEWLQGQDGYSDLKDVFQDLFYGGCQSGMVSHLIYYKDTIKFYEDHKAEINTLLGEVMGETGVSCPCELLEMWDTEDPLCLEQSNQNLLAWFGFEEVARKVADKLDIQV